jgi:holin-like protein
VSEVAALDGAAPVRLRPATGLIAPAAPQPIVSSTSARRLAARDAGVLVLELAGLWAVNKVGYAVVGRLHVPLPGNVAGMLLLFALLCTGIVPVRLFERSSTLLGRHLPFFFVPIAVGLMNPNATFLSQGWLLLLVLVASAAVGLCITGWLAQFLSRVKLQP